MDVEAVILPYPKAVSDGRLPLLRFYHHTHDRSNFFGGKCGLSSQAGAESSGEEDDLEEGFSELENEYGLTSEPEPSGDHDDIETDLELSETETEPSRKTTPSKRKFSKLFKAIMDAPDISVNSVLDKYVEEGNDLSRAEISLAMANLRRRRMYGRALQVIWHYCIMNFNSRLRDAVNCFILCSITDILGICYTLYVVCAFVQTHIDHRNYAIHLLESVHLIFILL